MADAVGVIRCLLCSCGMAANLLIVAIVTHFPAMRTACNVYVANLAAADFSFCLFALVQSVIAIRSTNREYSTLGWTYERSCDVGRVVVVFLAAASIILLTVIAVERYRAITDPLSTRRHGTVKHAGATCAVAWTAAALAAVIDTVARNVVTNDWSFKSASLHSGASCVVLKLESSDTSHPFFVMILLDFLFGYVLPGCVIIPLYVRIVVTVHRSRRLAVRESRTDDQAYLMVLVVTALFLANWLPFHVISFLIPRYVRREEYEAISVALSFAVFNSVANPFLYALLGRNFRDKLKKMFCCVKRCRNGRQWRPHSQASQDTTLTVQVIDTTGQAIGQAQATGGTEQAREQAPATGQVIDQTGQAREQAQATGQVIDTAGQAREQAQATGQVIDTTGQAREQAQATGQVIDTTGQAREQAQATGQVIDTAGQAREQAQASGQVIDTAGQAREQAQSTGQVIDTAGQAREQAQSTGQVIDTTGQAIEQAKATDGTEQAREHAQSTEQAQATGQTKQAQGTVGTEQAFPNGTMLTIQDIDTTGLGQATGQVQAHVTDSVSLTVTKICTGQATVEMMSQTFTDEKGQKSNAPESA
ncbi:PREDICTED: mu-type opioid receptor-like [Branchiostoma belcheri]|uniref:Mu-type opioid receptor-like n=1 Tax=Branchiostoma belcheri TaxID=7741 RepID=A0A6P4YGK6_BRABE|nr:PREDICTED: mu-type opioid receptor-like [Branchiostoma belcheri]